VVIVDLARLTFIDASGVAALTRANVSTVTVVVSGTSTRVRAENYEINQKLILWRFES
jgi:anti-anti-sigma regulatory factor